jgi:branched-chain amino acid transport system substrate-binding protein
MNKKKMTGILASLLIAAGVMAGCSSSTSNGSSDSSTIKIGANLELSGGTASFGQSVDEGLELALEEINKNGVNGKKL